MKFVQIALMLFFIGIILYQIKYLRELKIPIKSSKLVFYIVLLGIFIILMITFQLSYRWIDYTLGTMGSIILLLMGNISGISSRGFVYLGASLAPNFIPWKKVNNVEIVCEEDIEITVSSTFETKMVFDRSEFNEIVAILKDNLPNDIVEFK